MYMLVFVFWESSAVSNCWITNTNAALWVSDREMGLEIS